MNSYSMALKALFVSYVLISLMIVNIKGNIDTNPTEHLGHQRINHLIKRSSLKIRESENNQVNCTELKLFLYGDKYQAECNISLLNMLEIDANEYLHNGNKLPEDVATRLNNEYSKFCTAKCIEPYLKYYQCLLTGERLTFYSNYLKTFTCGRQNGDFCNVLYVRYYANMSISTNVFRQCTVQTEFDAINCSNPTPSCTNSISTLNENIGCCTQPLLGDLSACNIDSLNEPCNSAVSNNDIAPAVSSGTNNNIAPAFVTISLIITIVGLQFSPFFN